MKKKSWVKYNNEWIDLNSKAVKFLDIEEDVRGQDLITFSYLGKVHRSFCIISHTKP